MMNAERWEPYTVRERLVSLEAQVSLMRALLVANLGLSATVLAAVILR